MNDRRLPFPLLLICSLLLLGGCIVIGISFGRYTIPPGDVVRTLLPWFFRGGVADPNVAGVIWGIRLPRLLGAMAVGAGLALSGASYQGIFQNPLVSPDLLGVSSGACVGAATAILLGLGRFATQGFAFVGGIAAVSLALAISRVIRNRSNLILILSGIIISGLFTSLMGILIYIADPYSELPSITYWQLGSFQKVLPRTLYLVVPVMAAAIVILLMLRWKINIMSLGETEAQSLGISVRRVRITVIICSTLLTSCAVCISGTIGWVGLVIPHLVRQMVGPDNSKLLPLALVVGAVFMIVVDTIARVLTSADLPISILTGLIGAPFYFLLLLRQRTKIA